MFEFLAQYNNIGFWVLRIVVAIIFIYHALPKLKKSAMMAPIMGLPSGLIFLLGLIEFFSSIAIVAGYYMRAAALVLALVMIGAIGFKMFKWKIPFSAMDRTGWEFDLILLAANIAIILSSTQR